MTRIEIGITHEIVINGDKSWVRMAINEDYDGDAPLRGVGLDKAVSDLSGKVNEQLIRVIEQTVSTVEKYSN